MPESQRDQEIAECLPGEIATWEDGRDRPALHSPLTFAYSHSGAPAWFSDSLVLESISRAAQAWSRCGIPARVIVWHGAPASAPGLVLVRWSEADSKGNFGLANFGQATLSLGPGAFALLHSKNPAHDASATLQMVISHEMGHLFGLMAHSRRCVDVLSYYHDKNGRQCFTRGDSRPAGSIDYRHVLPTACDIERCRITNGKAAPQDGRPMPGPPHR